MHHRDTHPRQKGAISEIIRRVLMQIISGLFFLSREQRLGLNKHQSTVEALKIRSVFVLMIVLGDWTAQWAAPGFHTRHGSRFTTIRYQCACLWAHLTGVNTTCDWYALRSHEMTCSWTSPIRMSSLYFPSLIYELLYVCISNTLPNEKISRSVAIGWIDRLYSVTISL